MKQLFILGAGFSKALSQNMPTLWELSRNAINWDEIPVAKEKYGTLAEDVEQFLTYLYQEMPWKKPEEVHLDKATFLILARQITSYITARERSVAEDGYPSWAFDFVNYLHKTQTHVATLNYDTLVERLATSIIIGSSYVTQSDLYRLPITPLGHRTGATLGGSIKDTFRLLKLHGSTQWFSSGEGDNVIGHQVYYGNIGRIWPPHITSDDKIRIDYEAQKARYPQGSMNEILQLDLIPLIIPPVADKTAFYKTPLVKVLWNEFRKAIKDADEIYCVGYSLPKTDLTMRLFLRSVADEKRRRIFLVDNVSTERGKASLIDNYSDVFKGCYLDETYLGTSNPVEQMVADLCAKSGIDCSPAPNSLEGVTVQRVASDGKISKNVVSLGKAK